MYLSLAAEAESAICNFDQLHACGYYEEGNEDRLSFWFRNQEPASRKCNTVLTIKIIKFNDPL